MVSERFIFVPTVILGASIRPREVTFLSILTRRNNHELPNQYNNIGSRSCNNVFLISGIKRLVIPVGINIICFVLDIIGHLSFITEKPSK